MNKNSSIKIEYRYIVAAIYAVVLFLDRLDLTIVNIALPTLAENQWGHRSQWSAQIQENNL